MGKRRITAKDTVRIFRGRLRRLRSATAAAALGIPLLWIAQLLWPDWQLVCVTIMLTLAVMAVVTVLLLVYFWRRGWIFQRGSDEAVELEKENEDTF
jgi:hypothetical protein